jgi:hypothetical protein
MISRGFRFLCGVAGVSLLASALAGAALARGLSGLTGAGGSLPTH